MIFTKYLLKITCLDLSYALLQIHVNIWILNYYDEDFQAILASQPEIPQFALLRVVDEQKHPMLGCYQTLIDSHSTAASTCKKDTLCQVPRCNFSIIINYEMTFQEQEPELQSWGMETFGLWYGSLPWERCCMMHFLCCSPEARPRSLPSWTCKKTTNLPQG